MPGVIVIHIDIETDIRSFLSIVKSFQSCPFFAIIHILYSGSFFTSPTACYYLAFSGLVTM